ncbi:MAG: flavodoxin family protein [Paludibacteraceae bacterium]|nr:flavodoxin family protein [Paludibacteraceae bacterium]
MKVLLINGSPRKQGNTFRALSEIADQLHKLDIDSEIIQLGTKPVRGCVACCKCAENGNGRCVFDDDLCNRVTETMRSCDALIVGTPVYYGQPNGSVLALMQRMFYSAGEAFKGKPAAGVAVCRRGGATAALQTLNMPFQILHMPIVTSQYWNIVYGRAEGEAALDAEGMQTMRSLALNMARILRATANQPVPTYEPRQPMHFIR